jgi:hypothetical protein
MLFQRNDIGPDGTFDDALTVLCAGGLRYPGGSIAEQLFDIRNPDATSATDPESGATVALEPLSDVAAHAAETDRALCVVLPTRGFLSDDFNTMGHRFAAVRTIMGRPKRPFSTRIAAGTGGIARR